MERDEGVVEEIERITLADGMVEFCRDLRDSMTFYDRDVLLATYTGILESMLITALVQAGRRGAEALAHTGDHLERLLQDLPQRLAPPPGPLDIESFLQRFLEVGGQGLLETYPVYRTTLWVYFTQPPEELPEPDAALYLAYRDLHRDPASALRHLARVGAAFLRSAPLSAGWLRLEGPGAETVQSLWTLRDTVWSSMPPAPTRGPGAKVIDLAAVRAARLRERGEASWQPEPPSPEELFWDALAEPGGPTREAVEFAHLHPEVRWPLRALITDQALAGATEENDGYLLNAARLLAQVSPELASEGMVEALAAMEEDSPAFAVLSEYLSRLGARATRAVAGYIRHAEDVPSAVRLAPLLVRRRGRAGRDRRVFDLLAELLTKASWADGKERVAAALADFGDRRAVPLLERELKGVEPRTTYQEQVVRRALSRLANAPPGEPSRRQ